VTDGIIGAVVVHQPVGQIGHRPRVGNVVMPDDAGEDGVPVRLMSFNASPLVEAVRAGKAANLPVVLEYVLDGHPLLSG